MGITRIPPPHTYPSFSIMATGTDVQWPPTTTNIHPQTGPFETITTTARDSAEATDVDGEGFVAAAVTGTETKGSGDNVDGTSFVPAPDSFR